MTDPNQLAEAIVEVYAAVHKLTSLNVIQGQPDQSPVVDPDEELVGENELLRVVIVQIHDFYLEFHGKSLVTELTRAGRHGSAAQVTRALAGHAETTS